MRRQITGLPFVRIGVCLPLVTLSVAASAFAATPLSDQIEAEAMYVAAQGYMVKRVAEARKINAEAVALEIQNSISYVDAYFKRRELNRQWRAKENPNYLESEKYRQDVLKRRVEQQYQDVMRGDLTNTLNWLLRELSRPVVSYQYMLGGKSLVLPEIDAKLTARDLQLIRLTDGGGKASRLVFAAADGNVLLPHWPFSLRGDGCAAVRDNFERTRDAVVKEIQEKGKIGYENQSKLMQAINELFVALEAAYPSERRKTPAEFLDYAVGKRFLQTLLAAAHRAIAIDDPSVFSGSLRFEGESLLRLIHHMYQNGLEFAPPEAGGEGVYKSLFQNLRALYVSMAQERPPTADVGGGAAPRGG